jgi:hypothetical protein
MTTIGTITDTAKLEAAEDKLKQAVADLHRIVGHLADFAERNADEDSEGSDLPTWLDLLADDLNEVLDCLQIGLGRPYAWLLYRGHRIAQSH